jgi:hypothetical protein
LGNVKPYNLLVGNGRETRHVEVKDSSNMAYTVVFTEGEARTRESISPRTSSSWTTSPGAGKPTAPSRLREAPAPAASSPAPAPTTSVAPPPPPPAPVLSPGQQNALRSAEDYIDYTSFSRKGLIQQLEFEGYSSADATWAVDQLSVDWNQQAALKGAEYLDYTSFSRQGFVDQLVFEGFTAAEAEYGASQAYDG